MRTILYILLILPLLASSCSPIENRPHDSDATQAQITFAISCPQMEPQTRSLTPVQEKAVHDLNLYLFHKTTDAIKHIYTDHNTSAVTTQLIQGDYDVYVMANIGRDLGAFSKTEVAQYRLSISDESALSANSTLPMSAYKTITVSGSTEVPISLVRLTAKVLFTLALTPQAASEVTIRSVQLVNAPVAVSLFADNRASASEGFNYAKQNVVGNALSYSLYLFENRQGVNGTISEERFKNQANAPAGASYLYIQGTASGRQVNYSVYLGENNTTDFNVQRNGQYIVRSTISGVNTIDTRISTVELLFGEIKNPCFTDETISSSVTVKCTNHPNNQIYLTAMVAAGDGKMTVDGTEWPPYTPVPFCKGDETKTAHITYKPEREGLARLRFTLSDHFGYVTYSELATYVQKIHPIEILGMEYDWEKTAHTPLRMMIKAKQPEFTGNFKVKYELLQGDGTMYVDGTKITNGTILTAPNKNSASGTNFNFQFTPTAIGMLNFRLTFIGENGQTEVFEKYYTDITPLKIYLTPSYAIEQGSTLTITRDGYTGTYVTYFSVRLCVKADRPVLSQVQLPISLYHVIGEYKLNVTKPELNPRSTTAGVIIEDGSSSGSFDLETYDGGCLGVSATGTYKVLQSGFFLSGIPRLTAIFRPIINPETPSVEYIVNDPSAQ